MDFAEAAARNEEVVRSVNVRIDEAAEHHNVSAPLPFHCECSDASCVEKLSVAPEEYQRILDERFHFIVIPGHENDDVERVVAAHANYLVVEKTGEARAQIERDHPQARHCRPPDAR